MYQIQIDKTNAIVDFILDGYIRVDEMQKFVAELKLATASLSGRDIKIKADVRTFKPASPEAAEMIRQVQEFGLRSGVKRVAELVESQIVALQLNRVARESGTDKVLRRFWEDSAARQWLIHGEAAEQDSSP
ncbi:STAS/SEC14 domain-containing protein [Hyalangium versicolor]|uniref:STAS/SEC14 domain-containing protein n=1 Tax=Hyalangium versicolor TaxID=2861190 RepID=UPI001CCA444A|nr:STAS/SEC14 domain-containing protein [Hyalangium versicolor]